MDLTKLLNNPEDEPRRRPRPSFSTQNSQSPLPDNRRHSSMQTSTPISPPAPNSAQGGAGVHQGYFDRQPSALPSTPSSPHTRNPLVATPHSTHPHVPPVDTPNTSTQSQSTTAHPSPHVEVAYRQREQSLSVSPKTVVTNLPSHPRLAKFEQSHEPRVQQESRDMIMSNHSAPSTTPLAETAPDSSKQRHSGSAAQVNTSKRPLAEDPESSRHSGKVEPPVKRRRVIEIPIWAQPAKKLKPLPKYSTHGPGQSSTAVEVRPKTEPDFGDNGPLGPFEESFRGPFLPHEELIKQICDFLFQHVVLNESMGTSRVGEAAKIEGQLEIEAKIGTIIDKRTDERLELPITSEAILRPDFDIAFESMMTEQQHKSFNELLNAALKDSHGPPVTAHLRQPAKPRIRMSYEHRHEIDAFYDLPEDEVSNLPPSLQALLKSHSSRMPTVRVTRHKTTGKILSKIVKARISDLHVSSPSTRFDWRVSVNLEANWDGDLEALIQASRDGAGQQRNYRPDRNKDRMSYTHLFCQIDLTQVKTQETRGTKVSKVDVTHELEVELDSSAVREQGKLVSLGIDNQYRQLVQAFVHNVRILVRGVP